MTARTGIFTAPLPGSTPAGTSPTDGRLVLGAVFGTTGGCVAGNSWSVSSSAMQLTVGNSVWRIPDPTYNLAVFLSPADAYTFTLAAGPASGTRTDVLWVKQDNYENGDADSRVTYGVAQGTAGAGTPSLPSGCMAIATVTVPANAGNAAACTIVYAFGTVVAPPALLNFSGSTSSLPFGAYLGQFAYDSGGTTFRWDGSQWRPWIADECPYGFQNGFVNNSGGIHSTKNGRSVTVQFNVISPSGTLGPNSPIFYLNDANWVPAVSVDFICEARNSGGGVIGWAAVYWSTDGNLYLQNYVTAAGSVGSLPASTELMGAVTFRSAH